ncbi:hypothetical protein CEXT_135141 [Caerostris extrusa]|uniref:Uncharacterized protein n=1 Tax=Caerostris extrusa TaxID=172846 RepID=A0AAV4P147_CAEEX|nr:hypothetical protein CEXT_135141 [Caerostris extrusa]
MNVLRRGPAFDTLDLGFDDCGDRAETGNYRLLGRHKLNLLAINCLLVHILADASAAIATHINNIVDGPAWRADSTGYFFLYTVGNVSSSSDVSEISPNFKTISRVEKSVFQAAMKPP